MKKLFKRSWSLLFVCLMLVSSTTPVYAAQEDEDAISPMYAVAIEAACNCSVSPDSTLYITSNYTAGADSGVTRVDITVYVEKRNLLVLWDRVEIGQPNNEWTTICYGLHNTASHSIAITSGTYRVTSIFEVYCGRTLVETIEKTTNNFSC